MPNVELADANAVCTARQLGDVLGLTVRHVQALQVEGVLRKARGKLHGYKLAENVRRYLAYQRKYVAAECRKQTAAYDVARTRRMSALAESEELELQIARGDMIRRSRVVLVMTSMLATIKNHVLAIPSRCTRQVVGQKDVLKVRGVLDAACRDCLREASEFGVHSFDEPNKNGSRTAHADG